MTMTCYCRHAGCENEVDCGEELCEEHATVEFDPDTFDRNDYEPDRFWDRRD